jgi:hypothetical protein
VNTARAVLAMVQPKHILVIAGIPYEQLSKFVNAEDLDEFYTLRSSCAPAAVSEVQELPAGCIVTGTAAAVLSAAEV